MKLHLQRNWAKNHLTDKKNHVTFQQQKNLSLLETCSKTNYTKHRDLKKDRKVKGKQYPLSYSNYTAMSSQYPNIII